MTANANANRDAVLLAFHQACERPTVQDLIDWTTKYPEFADDIRAHAGILRDWDAQQGVPMQAPEELTVTQARSRALSALHNARKVAAQPTAPVAETFGAMLDSMDTNIRAVARRLDIGVDVLADMIDGVMTAPVGPRLVAAWTSLFEVSQSSFDRALANAQAAPSLGHAKAAGDIAIARRSYEDIVRSSSFMTEERIRYWLGEV